MRRPEKPVTRSFDVQLQDGRLRVCALSSAPILLVTGEATAETVTALRALADSVEAALGGPAGDPEQGSLL